MERFAVIDNRYLHPTPGGTYYAISSATANPSRRLLWSLLQQQTTPPMTVEGVVSMSGVGDRGKALEMLYHAQELGWVQGLEEPRKCPDQPLEQLLPSLLKSFSFKGKVLLADSEGFYFASHGFPHEVAEELSGMGAELMALQERRSGLLANNMGLNTSAWGLIDAAGNSKVGFWPLFVGKNKFVLVISGVPHFNQPDFVNLVWTLSTRYAADPT